LHAGALAVQATRPPAIAHAAGLWRAERWLHLDIEPSLNHLAAAGPMLAETAGYYYGLATASSARAARTAQTAWSTTPPSAWPSPP
jgi:hypothetical protein